jgi:hypothetical protein
MHFLDGILMMNELDMNEFLATGKLTDSRKSLFRVVEWQELRFLDRTRQLGE